MPQIEARFRLKGGEERVGVIGSAVVEIGGVPCVVSSVVDITERKRAEDALRDRLAATQRLQEISVRLIRENDALAVPCMTAVHSP